MLQNEKVHPDIRQLVADLHDGSWFYVQHSQQFAYSRTGGRQGCRLGGLVFNLMYAKATGEVRKRLADAGLLTQVPWHGRAAWAPGSEQCSDQGATGEEAADGASDWGPGPRVAEVGDATFVDDHVIMVAHKDADTLDTNLQKGACNC